MRVEVTVVGRQTTDDETAQTTLTAHGILRKDGDAVIITYTEPDAKTVITFSENTATVERRGELSSCLILQPAVTHLCDYHTPYGTMTLGVTASSVQWSETTGVLRLRYTLDMGNDMVTHHDLEIIVKEVS